MIKDVKFTVDSIRRELKTYLTDTGLKSLVLGISGGIDSALVAALAKPICDELNIPLIGRYISIDSNKPDEKNRADLIGQSFCTIYDDVNMTTEYKILSHGLGFNNEVKDISYKIRQGNIKARLRMINLYNLASYNKGMVLGTENLTEEYLGFFTIGGDEISDFELIKKLWKTEVYDIAEWICDNEFKIDAPHSFYDKRGVALMSCINADATDGLGISNTDLDQILPGFSGNSREAYLIVDNIFRDYFNYKNKNNIIEMNKLQSSPVIQRYLKSSFKRIRPIIINREKLFDNHNR